MSKEIGTATFTLNCEITKINIEDSTATVQLTGSKGFVYNVDVPLTGSYTLEKIQDNVRRDIESATGGEVTAHRRYGLSTPEESTHTASVVLSGGTTQELPLAVSPNNPQGLPGLEHSSFKSELDPACLKKFNKDIRELGYVQAVEQYAKGLNY